MTTKKTGPKKKAATKKETAIVKPLILDVTGLKTIQNFATEFGIEKRGEEYSTQYIYKLIKEKEEAAEKGIVKKLPFRKVEIDGFQFIQRLKRPA